MSSEFVNNQIHLVSRPQGVPTLLNFKLEKAKIIPPQDGEVLIQTHFLSVDPYMRGRLGGRASSHPPFPLNSCPNGDGLGQIIESKSPQFSPKDFVTYRYLDWAEYTTVSAQGLRKIDPTFLPLTHFLHALGMTGMTAYFGMLENGFPQKGETVVISCAAGAVGTLAGQIAKIKGCYVVGIASTDQKANFIVNEMGFDAAVSYKDPQFFELLKKACPRGIDVYFDNVGGTITDEVFKLINRHARIALCGQISTYNLEQPDYGLRHFRDLIVKCAQAKGFLVYDYEARFQEAEGEMRAWIKEGKIRSKEHIVKGLENTPKAFLDLFTGENLGKTLVQII